MNGKKKIYLALALFLSVVLVFGIWFMFDNKGNTLNDNDNNNYYIAAFIDGESSTTFPTSANYITDVVCKKNDDTLLSINATASWTGTKWKLSIKDASYANIYCNVNFITKTTWESPGEGTLLAAIKRDNTVGTPQTTPGRAKTADNEAVLASTEDDYGTSYYFRGAVTNNYVEFANKCWRIVRVEGSDSIKLVLHNDNTSTAASPCSSANNSSSAGFAHYSGSNYTSTFNDNYDDNAYVGFMYGTAGATSYTAAHANTNKSLILKNLETWYTKNLESYENNLADTIWCGDKSVFKTFAYGHDWGTGLGYAKNQTGYGTFNRIFGGGAANYAAPSLICPNDNNGGKLSKYTVSDIVNGNGVLDKKVGLLTMDELAFAGYFGSDSNSNLYLCENTTADYWWSMSPCSFLNGYAGIFRVGGTDGNLASYANTLRGVRPAISVLPTVKISSGDGTSSNPYKIVA